MKELFDWCVRKEEASFRIQDVPKNELLTS